MIQRNVGILILAACVQTGWAWSELITTDSAPYTYQDANWRAGNYIQSLFYGYADLPALSENFIGRGVIPADRDPDLYYIGNTGIDLLDYCEEAEFTPIVRLDLIKRIFKSMAKSRYKGADATWLVYSGTKRQVSFLNPSRSMVNSPGTPFAAVTNYPASRLLARNLPDTTSECLSLVWPRVLVGGQWLDDSHATFRNVQDNVHDAAADSYSTVCTYSWPGKAECAIQGKGWGGQKDKVLEISLMAPASAERKAQQLVFSNFTDPQMGFSAPYPTKLPETIQLPDGREIAAQDFSLSNPDFNYLIIYAKDAANEGFEYQNAMIFVWEKRPSRISVHWQKGGQSSDHKAYPGTEGITDTKKAQHSGGYCRVEVEYAGSEAMTNTFYLERFQGVDPSMGLGHIHGIARNLLATGHVGMPGYLSTESAWMEEPVSGLAGAAYILAKYDHEEDQFGGDYAEEACALATKLVDDRIAMWARGRKSGNCQEYVSGAYYLSLLYGLPGKFNNPVRQKYYSEWMCRLTDYMLSQRMNNPRQMVAIWRAYELSGKESYRQSFEDGRRALLISVTNGLSINGIWKEPWDFYSYGDVMAALGRRGGADDVRDIQALITYLEGQKRWTDNGYMGVWWEVTVENHNFFGRWCKGLQMADAPKRIISVNDFPAYYKKAGQVVVELGQLPPVYNPNYWNQSLMAGYAAVLPSKIAKSILFRIDNILLKTDYQNGWWSGTHVPAAERDLNTLKSNIRRILERVEGAEGSRVSVQDIRPVLVECDLLFKSIAGALEPKAMVKNSPAGGGIFLAAELRTCQANYDYLKAVLNGKERIE